MLKQTVEDYSKILDVNLQEKLEPVNRLVDEMLVRLEEFETMIALVQQERCNSIGLTGSLTQTSDYQKEFKNLCNRIDSLEKVVDHVKDNIDTLESKVEAAEKQLGITDNTSKLKNFLTPIFKKSSDEGTSTGGSVSANEPFSTEKYFISSDDNT